MLSQLVRYAPVISLIERSRPRRILEVGCGSQGLGKFVSCRFVGVDVDFSDYTGSRRSPSPWMRPVRAAGAELPFESGTFDLVVLLDVLEHVPPRARPGFLAECDRVARQRMAVGFPSGALAEAHDRELHHWLLARGLPVPGWLHEHLAYPFPTVQEVTGAYAGSAARVRVLDNAWLPVHRLVMRWEAEEPHARYSALLSDLLAPTAWSWREHRPLTNLLRVIVRPGWPLLRLLGRRPGYRTLILVEKTTGARGPHGQPLE